MNRGHYKWSVSGTMAEVAKETDVSHGSYAWFKFFSSGSWITGNDLWILILFQPFIYHFQKCCLLFGYRRKLLRSGRGICASPIRKRQMIRSRAPSFWLVHKMAQSTWVVLKISQPGAIWLIHSKWCRNRTCKMEATSYLANRFWWF